MIPSDRLPTGGQGPGLAFLAGTRVLDLTGSIAGPYAGQLLADLGATVVKIERPGSGDDARAWGPPFLDGEALWFLAVNRNKLSVELDYSREPGASVFHRLVGAADVVLLNQVERVQRKLGIDHASLCRHRPNLIHASITGFGLGGPRRDMPCYDLIAEGYSGVMDLTGEIESGPQKVGAPAADMLAGQDAAFAVLAALLRRQRTGEGCAIDVSLVASMTRFMSTRLSAFLGSGELLRRSGGRDSVIAIYQVFETSDEPLTLALGNDRIWQRFWSVVGDEAYGAKPQFSSNAARREHRGAIAERIQGILWDRPRAAWLDSFSEAGVPAGPINRLDEVAADPTLLERGVLYRAPREGGSDVPQIGLGILFDGTSERCRAAPPRLGADTAAVFGDWLGMSADEIRALMQPRAEEKKS